MPQAKRPKRILNCVPSPKTERDWGLANARGAGVLAAAKAAVPASTDLRRTWWKVADQGATGSCVGWATADSLLRWHFVKAGWIKQSEGLSARYVWMASKETDLYTSAPSTFIEVAGTSLKAALDVSRKFGVVRTSVLPFDPGVLYTNEPETFYAIAAALKIRSYFNLTLGRRTKLEDWRRWLATNGPILTRLDVDRTWQDARETAGKLDEYRPETARGGHAVAIVGYTPDRFIVRNSWGTGWGDKGFAHASLAYAQDAFTEAYGVAV
jgi:hypothetical protein